MSELTFGFTDCTPIPQEPQLVIPAPATEEPAVITVCDSGNTAYIYMEKAARKFHRWLTVTAEQVFRAAVCMVRAFVRAILPANGIQLLRRSAILNI